MKNTGLIILLFLFPVCLPGQSQFSQDILMQNIKERLYFLASEETEGRGTGEPGQKKAALYLSEEFKTINLKPLCGTEESRYFQEFKYDGIHITQNVLGYIPADFPNAEWVVVTAHYDHLGKRDEHIYYGADDNASGTTALMEIAGALSKAKQNGVIFNKNVLFIAFSAEELGLLGSKHFVNSSPGDSLKMILNVNMDMIGKSIRYGMVETFTKMNDPNFKENPNFKEDYVYVFKKGRQTSAYTGIAKKSAKKEHIKIDRSPGLMLRMTYKSSSDHKHFYDSGVPVMVFFTGLHPDYHTVRDTPDKIDYENLTSITKVIFEMLFTIVTK